MAHEIELKLALSAAGVTQLVSHPLLAGHEASIQRLANTYFDTPARALEKARIAMRLRSNGTDYWQTVKTAGSGRGGLHARGEWEWPVSTDRLDLDGLRQLPLEPFQDEALLAALGPVYCTDFERTAWRLEHEGTTVELALDQGAIIAADKRCAIRELELELKDGELKDGAEDALWRLAETLADSVALRPANTSKAARAVALRDNAWPRLNVMAADGQHPPRQLMEDAITALDAYTDTHDTQFLERARHALAAVETHPDPTVVRLATTLRQALTRADWLTPSFGRDSLMLLSRLSAEPY